MMVARVVRLLRRCLQKDPRQRLSAIGDARLEIDEAASAPAEVRAARRYRLSSPIDEIRGLSRPCLVSWP
jgi:hypothetical protein